MRGISSRIPAFVAVLVLSGAWLGTAHAAPIVVDWDVVPHDNTEIHFGDSQHYDCEGSTYTARLCHSLWDEGLTLEAVTFSFYDDKWFDGFGFGEPESSIDQGDGVQRITPECKAGLDPCFDSFSPLTLRIDGAANLGPLPNLFVISSRGGLEKAASVNGVVTFNFAGSAWQDLDWIEVGFYLPEICEGNDPPRDICGTDTEKALVIQDLTFDANAVPEPALIWLLSAGAAVLGVRRRYRS